MKILFYTDDAFATVDPDVNSPLNDWGLGGVSELIKNHDSDLADFEITLIYRHAGTHASNKLTAELLARFDQVWFFGVLSVNSSLAPEVELTDDEVAALRTWMTSGGVLMTGDHADEVRHEDPGLRRLLGVGRAIGHRVPRAGLLRRWEGPPGSEDYTDADGTVTHIYNTQLQAHPADSDCPGVFVEDRDEHPQRLILTTYPVPSTLPFHASPFGSLVHPLFCGRESPITVFPDHRHEGHLQIPDDLPADEWPSAPAGWQPRPEVVARGVNTHHHGGSGEVYDLVAAYDGAPAGVGRIVADSSRHHYLNDNLRGFAPAGPVLRQLAEYYVNLAVWLCSPAKRDAIACYQRSKLVADPRVRRAYGASMYHLGLTAAAVLRETAGPCVLRMVAFPHATIESRAPVSEPPPELLLGGIMQAYYGAFSRADAGDDVDESVDDLVVHGIRAAYDEFLAELTKATERAGQAREHLDERLAAVTARVRGA